MERIAQTYTLQYKNWGFKIDETKDGEFYVYIDYKDLSHLYIRTKAKTIEEAKERVEKFIKTELK